MKYYRICQKMLGDEIFNELINELLNKIIYKFGKEISVEQFVKILQINIDAILMLGLAIKLPHRKEVILNELELSISYLVIENIKEFEVSMQKYIRIISEQQRNKLIIRILKSKNPANLLDFFFYPIYQTHKNLIVTI